MNPKLLDVLRALFGDAKDGEVVTLPGGPRVQVTFRSIPKSKDTTFSFRMNVAPAEVRKAAKKAAEDEENGAGEEAGEGADDTTEPGFKSIGVVEGVASSTSKDWYGTEMALEALEGMAAQFKSDRGVPLLPSHGDFFSIPEWDSVIGRSIDAEIKRAEVVAPHDAAEPGYILTVRSALLDVPKARELRDRIDARQEMGQSIGGWFTALSVVYNEETDELERIIVLNVELDHLAVTRMPANPDSIGLANLRSRVTDAIRSIPRPPGAPVPEARSVNQPGVIAGGTLPNTLDTEGGTGNDSSIRAAEPPAPSQESDMTPEQIAELVRRSVTESVTAAVQGAVPDIVRAATDAAKQAVQAELAPVKAEIEALRNKTSAAPAKTPEAVVTPGGAVESDEARALKAEVEALRKTVTALADQPQRRGVHIEGRVPVVTSGPGADAAFRSLIGECRAKGHGTALAVVVERHIDTLSEVDGPAPLKGAGSTRSLVNLLAAGLRAAEADGLINTTGAAGGWA